MDQDRGIKKVGNRFDQRIVGHEIGIQIKGHAPVIAEQLQVSQQVNHEK
jgi:hypothetical protein